MNESAHKKPTLRDIARTAQVSVATVSRVLNQSTKVNEATRDHVNGIIAQVGYAPSSIARALSSGRSYLVGVLVPTLNHMIFARFLESFEQTLAESRRTMIVAVTKGDPEVEAAKARELLRIGVDALALTGLTRSPRFSTMVSATTPVVLTSCFDPNAAYPTIGYDNRAVAKLALRHLTELGHQRIAVVHGEVGLNERTQMRLDGLAESTGTARLTYYDTTLDFSGGSAAAARIAIEGRDTTAVLCLSDALALGALFELNRRGIRVPEDLSLMGFDNMEWTAHSAPRLTTVRMNISEMGRIAAQEIARALDSNATILPTAIPCELALRESTRQI
jgi:LacI family transcriptional regulator